MGLRGRVRCWPGLSTEWFDMVGSRRRLERLLVDDEYVVSNVDYAGRVVEFYGYEHSRKRFLEMLED